MLVMKFCTVWHPPEVGRPSSDLFLEARPGRDKLFGRLALLGAPAPQTPQLSCGAGSGVPGRSCAGPDAKATVLHYYNDDDYYILQRHTITTTTTTYYNYILQLQTTTTYDNNNYYYYYY